jgi:hypothetical protein
VERKTKINAENGKQELVITREFDLPVELLFKAYEEPEIVEQWMGTRVKPRTRAETWCLKPTEPFMSLSGTRRSHERLKWKILRLPFSLNSWNLKNSLTTLVN